mmetsp:Transcript_31643/g.87361  ORF Transcript_31643/g.87361 Transcript_31643/m.87361 type:complete len:206 (-) Transcript_31643:770-1387(-)
MLRARLSIASPTTTRRLATTIPLRPSPTFRVVLPQGCRRLVFRAWQSPARLHCATPCGGAGWDLRRKRSHLRRLSSARRPLSHRPAATSCKAWQRRANRWQRRARPPLRTRRPPSSDPRPLSSHHRSLPLASSETQSHSLSKGRGRAAVVRKRPVAQRARRSRPTAERCGRRPLRPPLKTALEEPLRHEGTRSKRTSMPLSRAPL